jgi:hypothetical protein
MNMGEAILNTVQNGKRGARFSAVQEIWVAKLCIAYA